jgi:hypothetical protein
MNLAWNNLTNLEFIVLLVALTFLASGITCVLFLFGSRIIKNYNHKKEKKLRTIFQLPLNSIIFNEDADMPEASHKFHIDQLNTAIGKSVFARHVLVKQVLDIKKSLTGATSRRLDRVYRDLNLIEFSKNKLTSFRWKVRAQGIRELTEVSWYERVLFERISRSSRNKTLREEIFMAIVRLDHENPLSFFEDYEGEVSDWMKINIYRYLSFRDPRTLPQFSTWFNNPNNEVVLFAIGMTKQFRQISSTGSLEKLLAHENNKVVSAAIDALTHLHAFQSVQAVLGVADRWWEDEPVCLSIVKYLGQVAHDEKHSEKLFHYLEHASFLVRLEATSEIYKTGDRKKLMEHNRQLGNKWDAFIAHAAEPLLQ